MESSGGPQECSQKVPTHTRTIDTTPHSFQWRNRGPREGTSLTMCGQRAAPSFLRCTVHLIIARLGMSWDRVVRTCTGR